MKLPEKLAEIIRRLFVCEYNLGRAVPPRKWQQHEWTDEDEKVFWKLFEGRLK